MNYGSALSFGETLRGGGWCVGTEYQGAMAGESHSGAPAGGRGRDGWGAGFWGPLTFLPQQE